MQKAIKIISNITEKLKTIDTTNTLHEKYSADEFIEIHNKFTKEEQYIMLTMILDNPKYRNEMILYFQKVKIDTLFLKN